MPLMSVPKPTLIELKERALTVGTSPGKLISRLLNDSDELHRKNFAVHADAVAHFEKHLAAVYGIQDDTPEASTLHQLVRGLLAELHIRATQNNWATPATDDGDPHPSNKITSTTPNFSDDKTRSE